MARFVFCNGFVQQQQQYMGATVDPSLFQALHVVRTLSLSRAVCPCLHQLGWGRLEHFSRGAHDA